MGLMLIILLLGTIVSAFVYFKGIGAPAISPTSGLSPVAKQIVKEYNRLPNESRPFPDVVSVVRGLDEKYAVDAVQRERHFNKNWLKYSECNNGPYRFSWTEHCNHFNYTRYCPFEDYLKLHLAIKSVQDALDDKQRVMLESQHDASTLRELESQLRKEAGLQKDFITKFKELG